MLQGWNIQGLKTLLKLEADDIPTGNWSSLPSLRGKQ
jgi:hypothetical protein